MQRLVRITAIVAWFFMAIDVARAQLEPRRPVALSLSIGQDRLFVANRDSGTVSVIDVANRSVIDEIEVGGKLADVVVVDETSVLVADQQQHQLVLIVGRDAGWRVAARLPVADTPVRLKVDRDSNRCFVASLWSQMITAVDLSSIGMPMPRLRSGTTVQLPFEPREMCLSPGGNRLIIASSFSAKLAVLDTEDDLALITVKELPGHNIRGLAIDDGGQHLLLAHQELNPLGRSTRDDVHWGNMLSNVLVSVPLDQVCSPVSGTLERKPVLLGQPGNAAGDPGQINIDPQGRISVLFSGVGEVALGGQRPDDSLRRVAVGRRPSGVVSSDAGQLFVADTLSDSISVVERDTATRADQISLGPPVDLSQEQLGEQLFFDSHLSHDGWMSCHSCHTDGHTIAQLNDNLSDGSFDAPKRILSLRGVRDTGPWAWNGSVESLEEQVRNSIQTTMQGSAPTDQQVASLVAFLKTLPPPPPPAIGPPRTDDQSDAVARGELLFHALDCQRCHAPPVYTSPRVYDVGLTDENGHRTFNPPSLRGVGRRERLLHDGRATSLLDVLAEHQHQLDRVLNKTELNELVQFLMSI